MNRMFSKNILKKSGLSKFYYYLKPIYQSLNKKISQKKFEMH